LTPDWIFSDVFSKNSVRAQMASTRLRRYRWNESFVYHHCDQIGQNFTIWATLFGVGRYFFNRPKFTLQALDFGYFLSFNLMTNFIKLKNLL
jgi:hypothetical protein